MVLGAAGGVGLAAVQIGKICGAIVIAVARYVPAGSEVSWTSVWPRPLGVIQSISLKFGAKMNVSSGSTQYRL